MSVCPSRHSCPASPLIFIVFSLPPLSQHLQAPRSILVVFWLVFCPLRSPCLFSRGSFGVCFPSGARASPVLMASVTPSLVLAPWGFSRCHACVLVVLSCRLFLSFTALFLWFVSRHRRIPTCSTSVALSFINLSASFWVVLFHSLRVRLGTLFHLVFSYSSGLLAVILRPRCLPRFAPRASCLGVLVVIISRASTFSVWI